MSPVLIKKDIAPPETELLELRNHMTHNSAGYHLTKPTFNKIKVKIKTRIDQQSFR